jgi:hypothetical protein
MRRFRMSRGALNRSSRRYCSLAFLCVCRCAWSAWRRRHLAGGECKVSQTLFLPAAPGFYGCCKKSFTNVTVWRVLACKLSIVEPLPEAVRWFVRHSVRKCFMRQGCCVVCGKEVTTGLPHYQWESHRTVTIPGETRCALLHYDSSKHCTCPPNKFIYAFKVVKLFLKHCASLSPDSFVQSLHNPSLLEGRESVKRDCSLTGLTR